jgi:hypothetical protein
VPFVTDPRVAVLYIRNYPTTSTYSILKSWGSDYAPKADFDGNCDNNVKTIEAGVEPVTIGLSFVDCDHNDVARNADVPGEMRIEMSQGSSVTHAGNIGTGYISTFTVSPGKVPYFHDQQKIVFTVYSGILGGKKTCESVDADKDC